MADIRQTLPRTVAVMEQGIADGLHTGAQVYVSLHSTVVADAGIGEARPGVPMTPDLLMSWLSSGKPVAAVALAQLWERGKLDLDDRVVSYIPEFGQQGKEEVTLRHVLTHTGGFPSVESRWSAALWGESIARICAAPLEPGWTPGQKAGYHAASGWFLLGEVVRLIDGRPYDRYVREEIFEPLGMNDSWLALDPGRYLAYGDRIGLMINTDVDPPRPHPHLDADDGYAICRPGGSAHGPIRELGFFYEMLLGRGQRNRVRIISPQSVEALTARHRVGMFDETFRHVLDWGLGFIPDNNLYGKDTVPYGYGPHCSRRTFGHSGSQSSTGFCDPEHGLVAAVVANGTPGEQRHQRRFRAITTALYEDLGLAG